MHEKKTHAEDIAAKSYGHINAHGSAHGCYAYKWYNNNLHQFHYNS